MDEALFYLHVDNMKKADYIAIDTETSGGSNATLWDGRSYCTGTGVSYLCDDSISSAYFPWRHPDDNLDVTVHLPVFKEVVLQERKGLIFHNAKFDIPSLGTLGIKLTPDVTIYDTLIMAHMVNEEFPSKELDWLAKFILKDEKYNKDGIKKFAEIFGWAEIPAHVMEPYGAKDPELTLRLFFVFAKEMGII